ncbi:hypothetical protein PI23P_06710 [Polaribacter irgensii 23-P]|uniref:Uncharacterized protein n=1 Tax=Polaribacter irgensii 23-P TaxID=313594 RepID=A4BYQ1_9FLAO|nr:hypothetical protein PI23P_06710 [Polaribacter irgensii 23-P]
MQTIIKPDALSSNDIQKGSNLKFPLISIDFHTKTLLKTNTKGHVDHNLFCFLEKMTFLANKKNAA